MLLPSDTHRILVLDDDEIMREILNALLSLEGYRVTLAQSGAEALQLLQGNNAFDLVLTDIQMPGLEREALAQSLRAAMPAHMLLIGMSGTEPSSELRDLFDAYVSKPFGVQLLRDAVEVAQSRKQANHRVMDPMPNPEISGLNSPLNATVFQSLSAMISAKQLHELFAMALKDIGKRHGRILDAAAENDLSTVHREAHAIKGSCGMIGAAELGNLAAAIEAGTTPDTSAIEEIPRACVRLQRMLNSKLHTA